MRVDAATKRVFQDAEPTARTEPPGLELLRQGETVPFVYSIERGLCKLVWRRPGERACLFGLRGPGSLLGAEMALAGTRATCSVITLTMCRLSLLDADEFRVLVQTNREFSSHIHRRLAG